MIELQLTQEELEYLHFAVQNCNPEDYLDTKFSQEQHNSVSNKIQHEFIANQIFELLDELESLSGLCYQAWQDKLWYEETEDEHTIAVKRNPKYWTWVTVGEIQDLIEKLEG